MSQSLGSLMTRQTLRGLSKLQHRVCHSDREGVKAGIRAYSDHLCGRASEAIVEASTTQSILITQELATVGQRGPGAERAMTFDYAMTFVGSLSSRNMHWSDCGVSAQHVFACRLRACVAHMPCSIDGE